MSVLCYPTSWFLVGVGRMVRIRFQIHRNPTATVHLNLRLSEGLRRRLAREARRRKCSLNTEVVARLEQSLLSEGLPQSPVTAKARALRSFLDEDVLSELVRLFREEQAEHEELIVEVERKEQPK
jgi:Arc-like DNA binding domain